MNKAIKLSSRISSILAILMFVLMVGYFVLIYYPEKFLPLPTFVEVKRIYTNTLAIGFLVLLPIVAISTFSKIIRVALLILAVPFCCLFSYLAMSFPEQVRDSTELANQRYHLTIQSNLGELDVIYTLYKCNMSNLHCEKVYTTLSRSDLRSQDLVVDEKNNEVHFIRNDALIFVYGNQSREVLESEQLGAYSYYLAVYPPYGSSAEKYIYSLYQCETRFTECHQLPFHYTDTGGSFILAFDDNTQEVQVYEWQHKADDILIYSYGPEPKCYVGQCTIPTQ